MIHDTALFFHIAGGSVAIVAGYAALAARKGARAHRIAGNVFFASMLVMAALASALALAKGESANGFGGVFTCYLVATGWGAVRREPGVVGRLEVAGFLLAAAMAAAALLGGMLARDVPSPPGPAGSYVLAALAGLAAALDLRMLRRGGLTGFERVRRHLWRMCAAMFVATGSFFLGQMDEIPRSLHGPHLWLLALAPLAALVWWMIRTRPRRRRIRPVLAAP